MAKKSEVATVCYIGDGGMSATVPVYLVDQGLVDFTFPYGESVQVPTLVADHVRDSPNFRVS